MPRDWPHPLDPAPSPAVRRWQLVERVVLAALLIAALLAAPFAEAGRRKGLAKRVRATAVRSMPTMSGAFPSCAEARAAGAAPVRRGQPGYGPRLDRDGDGVGCE